MQMEPVPKANFSVKNIEVVAKGDEVQLGIFALEFFRIGSNEMPCGPPMT